MFVTFFVTKVNLFIEFYEDLPTSVKFHAVGPGIVFFGAFIKNNLLYRYGSVDCDIDTEVSEQNEDNSTSISRQSSKTFTNSKKDVLICNDKCISDNNGLC